MRLLSAVREQDTSGLITLPMPGAASTDSPALHQLPHWRAGRRAFVCRP